MAKEHKRIMNEDELFEARRNVGNYKIDCRSGRYKSSIGIGEKYAQMFIELPIYLWSQLKRIKL